MKCFHCGAELKQLFYVDSLYCPNDCDRRAVSTETAAVSVASSFKCGDRVRVIKLLEPGSALFYNVGEEFYFVDFVEDYQGDNYNARVAIDIDRAKKGIHRWFVHTNELEIIERYVNAAP